ncbi:Inositol hexakisphosphate and diphosphoinositol-pentakisphosphate Kinase [Phytophthora cinnamomi]|uniref:Inositol hexakisphosphate and diphosphoinositol-pentakisphosphate Kinase n=1 Tax=Phytophthora cinnamomi TaxID=4785 RepID=UPI00355A1771|nr:Inositol hexakisphosphate and diphosphoinositol-pentakisphosphate Kinase [Phytophthora cinnamomi]
MQEELVEHDNYVEINGVRVNKPFVEKPADAEDHNVYIYYPTSAGGGSKRLFRKVGDRSSEFYPDVNRVRRDGSYIYEEFLNTQGTDVKVYTVGSSYGHAEARKSPVLDGRVVRDSAGKEVRYPVILNSTEKEMARKVCLAFHQTVCGFDLLRVRGSSYVCDVNGWSFVKNSKKYYDDCGLILHNYLVSALRSSSTGLPLDDEHREELRCVIAVVRHGDRTPKQKLKTLVWERDLVDFYEKRRSEGKYDEVKVKAVCDLQELLDLVRSLIKAYAPGVGSKEAVWEVEGGDSFEKLLQMKRVLERWKFAGINRKVQFKPHKSYAAAAAAYAEDPKGAEKSKVLMILKWGGDLTERDANKMLDHSGQADATEEMQVTKTKLRTLLQRDYSSVDEMKAAIAPLKTESIIQALDIIKNPKEALLRLLELVRKFRAEIAERVQDKQSDEAIPLYMGETFSLMFERWDKTFRDFYSTKTDTFDLSKIPDIHDCIKYDLLHNSSASWKCGLELFKLAEALARCYVSQEYGMDIAEKQSIGNRVSQALCAKIRADIVTVMSASAGQEESSSSSRSLYGNSDAAEDGAVDLADQDIEHHGYRLDPSYAKELRIKSPGTQVRTRLYFTSESHLHTLLNVLRFQCPSWRARHQDGGEDDEYDISLEQEKFSNEILKRMGISVNDHMIQRKYVFRESKLISDSSRRALDRVAEINYLAHIVIRVFETPTLPEDSEDRFRVEISFSPGVKDGLVDSPDGGEGVEEKIYLTKNMTGVMFEDMLAACVSSVQSTAV